MIFVCLKELQQQQRNEETREFPNGFVLTRLIILRRIEQQRQSISETSIRRSTDPQRETGRLHLPHNTVSRS